MNFKIKKIYHHKYKEDKIKKNLLPFLMTTIKIIQTMMFIITRIMMITKILTMMIYKYKIRVKVSIILIRLLFLTTIILKAKIITNYTSIKVIILWINQRTKVWESNIIRPNWQVQQVPIPHIITMFTKAQK